MPERERERESSPPAPSPKQSKETERQRLRVLPSMHGHSRAASVLKCPKLRRQLRSVALQCPAMPCRPAQPRLLLDYALRAGHAGLARPEKKQPLQRNDGVLTRSCGLLGLYTSPIPGKALETVTC